jgi:hypothetical protein
MNATATSAKIADGSKVDLVFGAGYVFGASGPAGRDEVIAGRLESRAANGDLVVLVDSSGTTKRVRPAKILSVHGDGLDFPTDAGPIIPDRLDDETGTAYLARLERELGAAYPRWIGTETGQATLAAVAAEDRAARKIALRSGIVGILSGTATADSVLADVAPAPVVARARAGIAGGRKPAIGPKPIDEIFAPTSAKLPPPIHDPLGPVPIPAPKPSGRPYAERNQVWKCGTCKRRTRVPVCTGKPDGSHPAVTAPAGKRRDDR